MVDIVSDRHEGVYSATGMRFAIVAARFNTSLTDKLVEGALDTLQRHGAERGSVQVARVPGSLEIPVVAKSMLELSCFDAIVALGVVIRGETDHYDHVVSQVNSGIARLALDYQVPISSGLVCAHSLEQAFDRCGGKAGNYGSQAALAAIETVSVLRSRKSTGRAYER
jgi:6,7-dimethyl-8-ribityllumazine synthase